MTTAAAGVVSTATGFVDPVRDFRSPSSILRMCSAFLFPSLAEETVWRAALLPHPSTSPVSLYHAGIVLAAHVASHPIAGRTVWPRGRDVFDDPRFLVIATIVLGGATASYIMSGGSVWAAAFTHGVPVALWRDCFGGEDALMKRSSSSSTDNAPIPKDKQSFGADD
eukprot:CAMPEP_0185731382 /NCGR_PEP_ID=MMETSP1171-20130828/12757_1 /TAXON_ID=374046 /ORGANISM="Helicotheca tamensis, Strain CCMP826" /LENGTH=166 /DNA_ID=CAMNT_0028400641 /DNA_START=53 /DNA_END=553 /DNA_ORIENTATION=+